MNCKDISLFMKQIGQSELGELKEKLSDTELGKGLIFHSE